MVMAQSLFRFLKQREPERPLDVLAPGWSLSLVARMPEIRQGIAAETGHGEFGIRKRRRIGYGLSGHYDRAIVLPRSLKAALIPWFAGIDTRTGFRGETRYLLINDMRPFDPGELDQTVKRFLALEIAVPATSSFSEPRIQTVNPFTASRCASSANFSNGQHFAGPYSAPGMSATTGRSERSSSASITAR